MKNKRVIQWFEFLFTTVKKISKRRSSRGLEADGKEDDNQPTQFLRILDTPFTAAKENGKWYLLLGKHAIAYAQPTLKDVLKDAERRDWERILAIIQAMIDIDKELRKKGEMLPKVAEVEAKN